MSVLQESLYFGFVLSLLAYSFGVWLKRRLRWAILNPLLVSVTLVILCLKAAGINYDTYNQSAEFISYLLTPATVCLAVPMYRQIDLLKQNLAAVVVSIASGVITGAASIFSMCLIFKLEHVHYVTLLPKSVTTAIGMGISEEAGGIVAITVACIVVTGIFGNIIAEALFKLFRIRNPIARGLALGTSAHAIGTAKALELGETEGAMSSLSIAVAGILTVVVVPLISELI